MADTHINLIKDTLQRVLESSDDEQTSKLLERLDRFFDRSDTYLHHTSTSLRWEARSLQWAAKEGENEEDRLQRVTKEEQELTEAMKESDPDHGSYGKSKEETLESIRYRIVSAKSTLAELGSDIDSLAEPTQWEAYCAFKEKSWKECCLHWKAEISSEEFSKKKPLKSSRAPALRAVETLRQTSVPATFYPGYITERELKSWSNGDHLEKVDTAAPSWEQEAQHLRIAGTGIPAGLDYFTNCCHIFVALPGHIASMDEEEAGMFSEKYPEASHEYRGVVQKFTTSLKQKCARDYSLNKHYEPLIKETLQALEKIDLQTTETLSPKLRPGSNTIQNCTATTRTVLQEFLKVAQS